MEDVDDCLGQTFHVKDAWETCSVQGENGTLEAPPRDSGFFASFLQDFPLYLRTCLCSWLTLVDVQRCSIASKIVHTSYTEYDWLKHCVLNGHLTCCERRSLWWRCVGAQSTADRWCERLSSEEEGPAIEDKKAYHILRTRSLPDIKVAEIERDVHRTFPLHKKFANPEGSDGRTQLFDVLRAVVAAKPEVGYCQGMNFVAAALIINLSCTSDAFWIFLSLVERFHFQYIYSPGVPLLPLRVFQFSALVRDKLPRLARHLKDECFSLDIFAHQCVLTLFAYSIEPDFLTHVYDIFFLLGWKAFFQIGLGLLASLEPKLIAMPIEDISRFMHTCKRHYRPSAEGSSLHDTLKALVRYDVSDASLESLQRSFQLDRWEALINCAEAERVGGDPGSPNLPPGLERCKSNAGYLLDANAFKTQNESPWEKDCRMKQRECTSGSAAPGEGCPEKVDFGEDTRLIPFAILHSFKIALDEFDADTQRDVIERRGRIVEVDMELAEILADTGSLRKQAREAEVERLEWLDYKRALMDSLNTAVKTSPTARVDDNNLWAPREPRQTKQIRPPRVTQDCLVRECLDKLKTLETEFFRKKQIWQGIQDQASIISSQIDKLQEKKGRCMSDLIDYIEARTHGRRGVIDTGFRNLLPDVF